MQMYHLSAQRIRHLCLHGGWEQIVLRLGCEPRATCSPRVKMNTAYTVLIVRKSCTLWRSLWLPLERWSLGLLTCESNTTCTLHHDFIKLSWIFMWWCHAHIQCHSKKISCTALSCTLLLRSASEIIRIYWRPTINRILSVGRKTCSWRNVITQKNKMNLSCIKRHIIILLKILSASTIYFWNSEPTFSRFLYWHVKYKMKKSTECSAMGNIALLFI